MPELEIWTRDADHCLATWDSVYIQVWRYTALRQAVIEQRRIAEAFIATRPSRRISSIGIVESTSPPPGREAREEFARFFRQLAPYADESIVVPLGGGLRAAVIRGVGVALSAVAAEGLRFRFVETVARASQVVAPYLSADAGGAEALAAAIEQARLASADKAWRSP